MPTAKKPASKKKATATKSAPARRAATSTGRARRTAAPSPKPAWSEQYEKAVKEFGQAVQLLNARKWREAQTAFKGLVDRFQRQADMLDIVDRCRAYDRICSQQLPAANPGGDEDHYLLGVYHSNRSEFDLAMEHFDKAITQKPGSDEVLYAMAATLAQKGDRAGALERLKQAVVHDDSNRIRALNDDDFDLIRDEPEFIDLVEPEEAGAGPA